MAETRAVSLMNRASKTCSRTQSALSSSLRVSKHPACWLGPFLPPSVVVEGVSQTGGSPVDVNPEQRGGQGALRIVQGHWSGINLRRITVSVHRQRALLLIARSEDSKQVVSPAKVNLPS